jgi:uncharacterized MAPEG superfamily protein
MYLGKFDNRNPRKDLPQGLASRAASAHYNAVEGFAPFAIAVVLNLMYLSYPGTVNKSNVEHWALLIKECGLIIIVRYVHFLFY